MTEAAELDSEPFCTTDGEIAVINLNSARLRSWTRFFQNPLQPGIAETVIEHEQLTAQFVGDLSALDRLESLVEQLVQLDKGSARTALIQAQIASMTHRFSDARHYLAQAELGGAPAADIKRLRLTIDQACGVNLDSVLDERRQIARKSGRLEDQLPLGALLADLRQFADADRTYRQGLRGYQDVSPFAPAWVCFQLGVLWGELVPEPQKARCRKLVSESGRIFAELHKGARASGGDLFRLGPNGQRGGVARSGAFERRSGSVLAPGRRDGRAGEIR